MIENIIGELKGLPADELQSIYNLIVAKKSTYHKPLAFVQELIQFSYIGVFNSTHRYQMQVGDEVVNRYGILHGGLMTTFIDIAMAETAFKIDPEVEKVLTLNICVDFVKSAHVGQILEAEVSTIQNTRSIIVFHVNVYEGNDVVSTAFAHFYKKYAE